MDTPENSFNENLEELRCHLVWRLGFVLIVFGLAGTWYMLVREFNLRLPLDCIALWRRWAVLSRSL